MDSADLLFAIVIATAMVTTTSTLILAGYAWSRRPAAGSTLFLSFMLSVAAWAVGQALELTSAAYGWKYVFLLLQYLGITFAPYFWLLFAFRYTGRKNRIKGRQALLLAIIPASFFLLALTNESHHLIWSDIIPPEGNVFLPLTAVYGPFFWIYVLIGSAGVALGGFLFIRAFSTQRFYRPQVMLLSVSGSVAILGAALHILGPSELTRVQPVSIAFAIATAVGTFTIIRYRIFDIVPVARGRLVDRMVDGVMVLDTTDRVIDMNVVAAQILNQPESGAVGRHISEVLREFPTLLEAYYDDKYRQTEVRVKNSEREAVYELSISRLHEPQQGLGGRVLMLHDISERKKLEKIRHELTYTMVHDLRNPITSNLTMLKMLDVYMDDLPQQDRQEMISAALRSMHRTLRLVDQIMEVNSLESGQVPLDPEPFSLAPVASDLLHSLITLAAEKNIQLNNDIATDLPKVLADPDLIARVLQNLVGNALKFTHQGGEIRLSALQLDNHVTIYVSDTGPGLAPEVREDPFAKFAVGPNKGRGSGLGLAFCKMVVEAHDQKIWVDHSSENGTTFAFSLPVAPDASPAPEPSLSYKEETIS